MANTTPTDTGDQPKKPTKRPKEPKGNARASEGRDVQIRPANPFDLIRLIAYSQSDARKAVAELVQNSLDAGANHVVVTRLKKRGQVIISIADDGRGIFPSMERPDALHRIATNVGHSFKRNLSAAERQQQMLLGKYGIGLLGFWCVGQEMQMRTRVSGSEAWSLRLIRDQPMAEVRPIKKKQGRISFDSDTWTEIVIFNVHPGPSRQLSGRRLGEYLGAELRGQLLARNVKLRMVDRLARSSGVKDFLVVPQRFDGTRLDDFGEMEVPGFSSAKLELYLLAPESEASGKVSLCCGGTVVAEDIGAVDVYELNRNIWCWSRLQGVIEFADLDVAPTTRRGFSPSPAADALFAALKEVEPRLQELFERENQREREEHDENVAKEIRSTFRPLARVLPQYDFFEINSPERNGVADQPKAQEPKSEGAHLGATESALAPMPDEPVSEVVEPGETPTPAPSLFEPGPLHQVVLHPKKARILPGAARSLQAIAIDEDGHRLNDGLEFFWQVVDGVGFLDAAERKATLTASHVLGVIRVTVTVRQGDRVCEAASEIEVVTKLAGDNPDAGIPDPERAFDPNGDWRSRLRNGKWEYNAAHPDYRAVDEDPRQRLRYFVHLFTKEIVLFNYGDPSDERLLERMVEVLTHIKSRT